MLAEQRYAKILQQITANGVARTAELAETLNASSETVRKDLEFLDRSGSLIRVHGGAVARQGVPISGSKQYVAFEDRQIQHQESKQIIALRAADMVREGQSVALDSGTTSYELAKILKQRFSKLTIATNSLKNAVELVDHPGFTVMVTGGILTADEHSFVSEFAATFLEQINVDIMFLTTCGVSLSNGITDQRIDEVRIHNKMRSISRKVVVLADGSKIGKTSLISVCGLRDVDAIITDSSADPLLIRQFAAAECELVIAT